MKAEHHPEGVEQAQAARSSRIAGADGCSAVTSEPRQLRGPGVCDGTQRPWNPGCRRSALEGTVMPVPTHWMHGPLHCVAGKS